MVPRSTRNYVRVYLGFWIFHDDLTSRELWRWSYLFYLFSFAAPLRGTFEGALWGQGGFARSIPLSKSVLTAYGGRDLGSVFDEWRGFRKKERGKAAQ